MFLHTNGATNGLDQLRRMLGRLRACRSQLRSAVGAGVQLANTNFLRHFADFESFRRSTSIQQQQFWSDLGELELGLRNLEAGMAMGVGLYRIWLADLLAGRHKTAEMLGEELTELSRRS